MKLRASLDFGGQRPNLGADCQGTLLKRGKTAHRMVRRYFRLKGSVLSNHKNEKSMATWQISLYGAQITDGGEPDKLKIHINLLKKEEIVLQAEKQTEYDMWMQALSKATKEPGNDDITADHEDLDDDEEEYTGRRSLAFSR